MNRLAQKGLAILSIAAGLTFAFQNCSGKSTLETTDNASTLDINDPSFPIDPNNPNEDGSGANTSTGTSIVPNNTGTSTSTNTSSSSSTATATTTSTSTSTNIALTIINIYRYSHSEWKDRYYLKQRFETSSAPSSGGVSNPLAVGYSYEGIGFKVISSDSITESSHLADKNPVYLCLNKTFGKHFISVAANCEGSESSEVLNEGLLGYVFKSASNSAGLPVQELYRCYWEGVGHLTTPVRTECTSSDYPAKSIDSLGYSPL